MVTGAFDDHDADDDDDVAANHDHNVCGSCYVCRARIIDYDCGRLSG